MHQQFHQVGEDLHENEANTEKKTRNRKPMTDKILEDSLDQLMPNILSRSFI